MKATSLLLAAVVVWAQTDQRNPGAQTDPVSKTGPVAAVPEPELACAGNRPEFLEFPMAARAAHLEDNVTAAITVTPEGKLKDLKLSSSLSNAKDAKLFEDVVSNYLQQSSYPPGCEKEQKKLIFQFFFKGDPAAERKALVEFITPDKFEISVNPDLPAADRQAAPRK